MIVVVVLEAVVILMVLVVVVLVILVVEVVVMMVVVVVVVKMAMVIGRSKYQDRKNLRGHWERKHENPKRGLLEYLKIYSHMHKV